MLPNHTLNDVTHQCFFIIKNSNNMHDTKHDIDKELKTSNSIV